MRIKLKTWNLITALTFYSWQKKKNKKKIESVITTHEVCFTAPNTVTEHLTKIISTFYELSSHDLLQTSQVMEWMYASLTVEIVKTFDLFRNSVVTALHLQMNFNIQSACGLIASSYSHSRSRKSFYFHLFHFCNALLCSFKLSLLLGCYIWIVVEYFIFIRAVMSTYTMSSLNSQVSVN